MRFGKRSFENRMTINSLIFIFLCNFSLKVHTRFPHEGQRQENGLCPFSQENLFFLNGGWVVLNANYCAKLISVES